MSPRSYEMEICCEWMTWKTGGSIIGPTHPLFGISYVKTKEVGPLGGVPQRRPLPRQRYLQLAPTKREFWL